MVSVEGFHSARLPLLKTKCSVFSPQTSLVQNPEKEELSDEEEDLLLSPGQVSLNASVDVTFELDTQ